MSRITFDIIEEPCGEIYRGILDCAAQRCDSFELVTRPSLPLTESAMVFLLEAKPFMLRREERGEWFGTKLTDDTATVHGFKMCPETISLLKSASDSLFSWLQPDLPEDLCLIRSDGTPWLVTISHERDGYFQISHEEKSILTLKVPDLAIKSSSEDISGA